MKIDQDELSSNLEILFQTENRIAEIIRKDGLRFSTNKMTADLGEFYVFKYLSNQNQLFESIEPQLISNAEFDFSGKLAPNSILFQYFNNKEIRIEVKTRRNQKGVKYLASVKPAKFELLCVVDLAKNYTLNNIFLVKSETASEFLDEKYKRLLFKDEMAFMTLTK